MWRNGWECMDHLLLHCPVTASLWPSLSAKAILSWDDSGMHCCVKGLSSLEGRQEVKYWEMSWGGHFLVGLGGEEKKIKDVKGKKVDHLCESFWLWPFKGIGIFGI